MVSLVPKHLRKEAEYLIIDPQFLDHVIDLNIDSSRGVKLSGTGKHRAKYAPGLATELLKLAGTDNVGDPMSGTGTLARETGLSLALNDIDVDMMQFLNPLAETGCEVSYKPATEISWKREVCIFSPPYYPKADRKKPCAHNDAKRGPIVGFRDSYNAEHQQFIGNPSGVNAILHYRNQMTAVYAHLLSVCDRMIVVTKNWTRLGVELRLDLDTILMAQSVGWVLIERHGWQPNPSLWSQFNTKRGTGITVEDILIFNKPLQRRF